MRGILSRVLSIFSGTIEIMKEIIGRSHQGSVEEAHLQSYLDEFVFRFNRRRSRSRGLVFYRLLELVAGHDPVRYRDIVAGRRPRKIPPTPPARRRHPPSLGRPPVEHPSR